MRRVPHFRQSPLDTSGGCRRHVSDTLPPQRREHLLANLTFSCPGTIEPLTAILDREMMS